MILILLSIVLRGYSECTKPTRSSGYPISNELTFMNLCSMDNQTNCTILDGQQTNEATTYATHLVLMNSRITDLSVTVENNFTCLLFNNIFLGGSINLQCGSIVLVSNKFQQAQLKITMTAGLVEHFENVFEGCVIEQLHLARLGDANPIIRIKGDQYVATQVRSIVSVALTVEFEGSCFSQFSVAQRTSGAIKLNFKSCLYEQNTLWTLSVIDLANLNLKGELNVIRDNVFNAQSAILYSNEESVTYSILHTTIERCVFDNSYLTYFSKLNDNYEAKFLLPEVQLENCTITNNVIQQTLYDSTNLQLNATMSLYSLFFFNTLSRPVLKHMMISHNQFSFMPMFALVYTIRGSHEIHNLTLTNNSFAVIDFKLFYCVNAFQVLYRYITWHDTNTQNVQFISQNYKSMMGLLIPYFKKQDTLMQSFNQGVDQVFYQICLLHEKAARFGYPLTVMYFSEGFQVEVILINIYPHHELSVQMIVGNYQQDVATLYLNESKIVRRVPGVRSDLQILKVRGTFSLIYMRDCQFEGLLFEGISPVSIDASDQDQKQVVYSLFFRKTNFTNITLVQKAIQVSLFHIIVSFGQNILFYKIQITRMSFNIGAPDDKFSECDELDETPIPQVTLQPSGKDDGTSTIFPGVYISTQGNVLFLKLHIKGIKSSDGNAFIWVNANQVEFIEGTFVDVQGQRLERWMSLQAAFVGLSRLQFHQVHIGEYSIARLVEVVSTTVKATLIQLTRTSLSSKESLSAMFWFKTNDNITLRFVQCYFTTLDNAQLIIVLGSRHLRLTNSLLHVLESPKPTSDAMIMLVYQSFSTITISIANMFFQQINAFSSLVEIQNQGITARISMQSIIISRVNRSLLVCDASASRITMSLIRIAALRARSHAILNLTRINALLIDRLTINDYFAREAIIITKSHSLVYRCMIVSTNISLGFKLQEGNHVLSHIRTKLANNGSVIGMQHARFAIMKQVLTMHSEIQCLRAANSIIAVQHCLCFKVHSTSNGSMQIIQSNVTMLVSMILHCQAGQFGGGLYVEGPGNIYSDQLRLVGNQAEYGEQLAYFSDQPLAIDGKWQGKNDIITFPELMIVTLVLDGTYKRDFKFRFDTKVTRVVMRRVRSGANMSLTGRFMYSTSRGYTKYAWGPEINQTGYLVQKTFLLVNLSAVVHTWNRRNTRSLFVIELQYRNCTHGEMKSLQSCIPCIDGRYSYTTNAAECTMCPQGGECQNGTISSVLEGYWRASGDSVDIVECSSENCIGGNGRYLCQVGYIGALCEQCDHFNERGEGSFFLEGPFKCRQCQDQSTFVLLRQVLAFMLVQVGLLLITRNGLLMMVQVWYIRYLTLLPIGTSGLVQISGILIKIIVKHLQIFQLLKELIFSQSSAITQFLSTFEAINIVSVTNISPYCLLYGNPDLEQQYPFIQLGTSMLLVLSVLISLIALQCALNLIYSRTIKYQQLLFVVVSQYILFYPSVANDNFAVLSCRTISGVPYMSAMTSYVCYTSEHKRYLLVMVFPILIGYFLVVPLGYLYRLMADRKRYQTHQILTFTVKYGILCEDYRETHYYYEFVRIVANIGLAFIVNFFVSNVRLKVLMIIQLLIANYYLTQHLHPYIRRNIQTFDRLSSQLLISCFIMSLIMQESQVSSIRILIQVGTLLTNLAFLSYLGYTLMAQLFTENRPIIDSLLVKLKCKVRCRTSIAVQLRWKHLIRAKLVVFQDRPATPPISVILVTEVDNCPYYL